MTEEIKKQIVKRVKSFLWRLGCVMGLAGLNFVSEQITTFSLPSWVVGFIGLMIGEIMKWINSNTNLLGGNKKNLG